MTRLLTNIPVELAIIAWVLFLWLFGLVLKFMPVSVSTLAVAAAALPATLFFWYKPAYGIVALMFFASGFLQPDFIDIRLPIGGGFEMRDLLLLLLTGLTFFQRLSRKDLYLPWWPVGGYLFAFLVLAVFSLYYALFIENVASNWALSDMRILMFYCAFFITAWGIQTKEELYTLVIGSFVVTDITAGIVVIQQYLGPHNLLLEAMNDGSWQVWEAAAGATRVVPPGIVFMYFMMLVSFGMMIYDRRSWQRTLFWLFHTGFLGLSLLLTFTRSAWVASGIGLPIIILLLFPLWRRYIPQIFFFGTAITLFIVGIVGLAIIRFNVNNPFIAGVYDRFASIFTTEETVQSNSLQWRLFELQETSKDIREKPLTGVGLGGSYRPVTVFQGEAQGLWTDGDISARRIDRFTRYAHSSYLAIPIKMGIPALVVLMLFCFSALTNSIGLYRRLPNEFEKGLVLTIGPGMLGLLFWSIMHAHLMLVGSTAVVALVLGMLASIHRIFPAETSSQYAG